MDASQTKYADKRRDRDGDIKAPDLKLEVKDNKIIAIGSYKGKSWRTFAYIGSNYYDARTSVLMEWKEQKRLWSLNESQTFPVGINKANT